MLLTPKMPRPQANVTELRHTGARACRPREVTEVARARRAGAACYGCQLHCDLDSESEVQVDSGRRSLGADSDRSPVSPRLALRLRSSHHWSLATSVLTGRGVQ